MDFTQAGPSNGQHRPAHHEAHLPPPQKRRRTSTSPRSPTPALAEPPTPMRIKQEPRERWVEIEAQYGPPSPPPLHRPSTGNGAQRGAPLDSSSLSSTPTHRPANRLPSAPGAAAAGASGARASAAGASAPRASAAAAGGSAPRASGAGAAAAAKPNNDGPTQLNFPGGRPWPIECEEALIRYVARHNHIRRWAESGGEKVGLEEGLQRFIDMHGLSNSVASLEAKLKDWGQQYSGLNKRLTEAGQTTQTHTWTSSYDKSYLESNKFSARLALWHDHIFLHWLNPEYVSPKRTASRSRRPRSSSQTSAGAGPSSSRARRSTSRITSSLPSTAVASGAPKSSVAAASTAANASPSSKLQPKKSSSKLPKPAAEESDSTIVKLLRQQAAEIADLKALSQRQTQMLSQQATQLKRQAQESETRFDQHTDAFEFIKRQLKVLVRDRNTR